MKTTSEIIEKSETETVDWKHVEQNPGIYKLPSGLPETRLISFLPETRLISFGKGTVLYRRNSIVEVAYGWEDFRFIPTSEKIVITVES